MQSLKNLVNLMVSLILKLLYLLINLLEFIVGFSWLSKYLLQTISCKWCALFNDLIASNRFSNSYSILVILGSIVHKKGGPMYAPSLIHEGFGELVTYRSLETTLVYHCISVLSVCNKPKGYWHLSACSFKI